MLRLAFLCLALTLPALGQSEVYIRNRAVQDAVVRGGERYIPVSQLERFFTPEEIARLQLDYDSGNIKVDGSPLLAGLLLGDDPRAPVVSIAEALGFKKTFNNELGVLDLVSPKALEKKEARQTRPGGPEWERARQKMNLVVAEHGLSQDEAGVARVRKIGDQIAAVSDAPTLQWNLYVLASPTMGAGCTGIGFVYIDEGLLRAGLTDDELAGVIAHEVAHGCRRDLEEASEHRGRMKTLEGRVASMEQQERVIESELRVLYTQTQTLQAQAARAEAYGNASGDYSYYRELSQEVSEYAQRIDVLEGKLISLREAMKKAAAEWKNRDMLANSSFYKHKDEIDADVKGLYFATSAGFREDGLLRGLQKLLATGSAETVHALAAGGYEHPPLSTRLEILSKVMQDWRKSGRP